MAASLPTCRQPPRPPTEGTWTQTPTADLGVPTLGLTSGPGVRRALVTGRMELPGSLAGPRSQRCRRPARRPLPAIPHAPGYRHNFHSMVRSCKIICKATPPRPVRVRLSPPRRGQGGHWPCQLPCFAFLTWACTAFAWFCILHEQTPLRLAFVFSLPALIVCGYGPSCPLRCGDPWHTVSCSGPRATLATPFPSR